MSKLVTIVGATGQQGKGVIAAFAGNPGYRIRGLTRNPAGPAGQALASQGIEVVKADLDDLESLKAAFQGSHIIFAVTDFWESFEKFGPAKAKEIEFHQGSNLAKAASATLTLEHYIWSSMPNGVKEFPVPHFESKYNVEEFIRSDPQLLAKSTFIIVCFYANNIALSSFRPYYIESAKKHVQFTTYSPETPIPFIGDVTRNITPFIKAIVIDKPEETKKGAVVVGSIGSITSKEWMQMWSDAKGIEVQLVHISREENDALWPWPRWSEEFALMMAFFEGHPIEKWLDPSLRILTAEHLGISEFQSVQEWVTAYELPEL